MLYSITLVDRPHSAALRAETAATHRDYVGGFFNLIALGGPLLAADGKTMIGSQIVIDLPDAEAAQCFVDNEPYNRAGLFSQVLIHRFGAAVSNPDLIKGNKT
ncbi:MAG: YciI family protein [Aestuariivita sp.]|uniref:YciI family protein n=1 Tax=Aestuariivita sp. TaxID=1872407 RepID=UPI003BB116F1